MKGKATVRPVAGAPSRKHSRALTGSQLPFPAWSVNLTAQKDSRTGAGSRRTAACAVPHSP
jgi:hypothetical protein